VKQVGVGQVGHLEEVVGPEHAANRFENTGVTVLATPVLCHWFESASVRAIAPHFEPGEASVGTRLTIEHRKATPLGMRVRVESRVVGVDGRRITFEAQAVDEVELVARGTHERFVVDLERFITGVEGKSALVGEPRSPEDAHVS
jgi:fluoroacetyl-CoA thioesterase